MKNFFSLWAHFLRSLFHRPHVPDPAVPGATFFSAAWIVLHHWYGEPRTRQEALAISLGEGYTDLPYNFLITRDGHIWNGRPVGSCAANLGLNSKAIAVCFLGNLDSFDPTPEQIKAGADLLRSLHAAHPRAKLIQHCDVVKLVPLALFRGRLVSTATACPGRQFVRGKWAQVLWAMVNGLDYASAVKKVKG